VANFFASLGCDLENSGCARGGPPRLWQGRVFTSDGRPAARATVRYVFASNQPGGRPAGRQLTIETDERGRYCLRWPEEVVRAYVSAADVTSREPPDPRMTSLIGPGAGPGSGSGSGAIIVTPDAAPGGPVAQDPSYSGRTVSGPWEPAQDATSRCVTKSPPWNRIDDLRSNWRFRLLLGLSLAALLAGLAGVFITRGRLAGLAATLAISDAALFVLIWITHSI
jgi:hypothetical protein